MSPQPGDAARGRCGYYSGPPSLVDAERAAVLAEWQADDEERRTAEDEDEGEGHR